MTNPTCKERVGNELKGRIYDLEKLFNLYQEGNEEGDPEIGNFNEYGLSFDYVAPNTFTDQKRGYFRYQLSWGGPSDEFRFYTDENFNLTRIEYWFLDWNDGAKKTLNGKNKNLMTEIFEFFKEVGSVESEFKKAQEV